MFYTMKKFCYHYARLSNLISVKYIVTLILCTMVATTASGQELSSFKAIYKIGIPNIVVAEMTVIVKRENNTLLYQNQVVPKGLVGHLINIKAHSYSKIIKRGEHWLPLVYEKETSDRNKHQLYRFDWRNYKVQVLYKGEQYDLDLNKGVIDENTFQLQLRDDVINSLDSGFNQNYTLLSDGRLKERRFVKKTKEIIETELGNFSVIRIERYKNEIADQIYWFSPEHHYLPLKIVKLEGNNIKTTLTLVKLVFMK